MITAIKLSSLYKSKFIWNDTRFLISINAFPMFIFNIFCFFGAFALFLYSMCFYLKCLEIIEIFHQVLKDSDRERLGVAF